MWWEYDVCRPDGYCTSEKMLTWTWSLRAGWPRVAFGLLCVFTGVFAQEAGFMMGYYKVQTAAVGLPPGRVELLTGVVAPAAAVPLLAATAWLAARAGRFTVIMDLLVLVIGASVGLWLSEEAQVALPLVAIVESFAGPALASLGTLWLYESVPVGQRLGYLLSVPVVAAAGQLAAAVALEATVAPTRHRVIAYELVTEQAWTTVGVLMGSLVGLSGLAFVFGVLAVGGDTAVSLVSRGFPEKAYSVLLVGEAAFAPPLTEPVFTARCQLDPAPTNRGPHRLWRPLALLALLAVVAEVLNTSFLEQFGAVVRYVVFSSKAAPGIYVELAHVAVLAADVLLVWLVKAQAGSLRFLPAVAVTVGCVGAVICTSILSSAGFNDTFWQVWQVPPTSVLVAVVIIYLALPVLDWALWVLALDVFSANGRPGAALALTALRGATQGLLRLRFLHALLDQTWFALEALAVGVCSGLTLWALYQTRWFDRSLLCLEDPDAGWLESDERLRLNAPIVVRAESDYWYDESDPLVQLGKPSPFDPVRLDGDRGGSRDSADPSIVDYNAVHASDSPSGAASDL